MQRIHVEDTPGARLIADGNIVAGEAEYVLDAHGGSSQQITLDGNAVSVATVQLKHCLVASAGKQRATANTTHVAVGASPVGGVNGIAALGQHQRVLVDILWIGAVRSIQFGSDSEATGPQRAFQATTRTH
jgi:hypothetical protein